MEPYSAEAAKTYPLNESDDWLRKHQGLALPVLPPTTLEAQNFFFKQIRHFADEASLNGKQRIDFEILHKNGTKRQMEKKGSM